MEFLKGSEAINSWLRLTSCHLWLTLREHLRTRETFIEDHFLHNYN